MKIGICQTYPRFGLIHENVNNACRVLNNIEADLVVLPELFNSGYQFTDREEVKGLAEEVPQGFTTEALIKIARVKGSTLLLAWRRIVTPVFTILLF